MAAALDAQPDRFRLRPDQFHHRIEFRRRLDPIEAGDEAERQDIHQRVTVEPARLNLAAQTCAARRKPLIEMLLDFGHAVRALQQQPAPQVAGFIEAREKRLIAAMIGAQRLSRVSGLLVGENDESGTAGLEQLVNPRQRCAQIVEIIKHVNGEDQVEAALLDRRVRQERRADRSANMQAPRGANRRLVLREVIGVAIEDHAGRAVGKRIGDEGEGLAVAAADIEKAKRLRRLAALRADDISQNGNEQFALIGAEHEQPARADPI